MLTSVVKISVMSAKCFEYYTIMLRGAVFFVDTLYYEMDWSGTCKSVSKAPRFLHRFIDIFKAIKHVVGHEGCRNGADISSFGWTGTYPPRFA